CMQSMDYPWTF
nr:immunoglobulin light chain junction region [Macaca mulatta]